MTSEQRTTADWFSKPGDTLRTLMQRREITANELSRHVGGPAVMRGLLDGSHPIDVDVAGSLASALGGTQSFWLKRQASYEEALDRAVVAAASTEAADWLERVPAPGARRGRRLDEVAVREELRRRISFFNVPTMRSWQARYGRLCTDTRFRTSGSFSSSDPAVLLWLRRGELEADLLSTRLWNAENLRDRVIEIRKLSRISQPARFLPKLRTLCAEAGVAVVVVKTPPGCHASGASRLVTADKAMMLLSFRHRADDQFWFTVFHEIGHLVLHGAKTFVDEDATPDDDCEREANHFASQCIVPENRLSEFESLRPDRDAILRYSVSVGVAPGLTVGQMQHRRMIERNRLNMLKRRWTWDEIDPALV
ncbi:ImmA/IrrE family metallo-endopeptidase [Glacieibacterium frigidum]|uniref:ImmA/IrrE family metallo-endopeptidase n=1 Tax=Glacieibacterium frigidum TaxID=2593303 RepID=A0A552UAA4_9SPHN|nr:ImmA/IrrE family metallo-endopeptidase [Glacieibacterium frigidum]TRW15133.1 ImmA/IrrE family metallo-endopeptidase [Glacieibacterium frigidum]